MRKERNYNYIYKTTCSVTNRYYIGMHSTDDLDDGYLGSGKRLWFSINYHGKSNHIKEIIEYCNTRAELKKREEEIVNEQLLKEDLCMNLMTGGQGGFSSEEHMKKFLEKGATMSLVNKDKIMVKKNWLWDNDKDWSDEYSKNMSINSKGNKSWTNKHHSDETKKKMSETQKLKTSGKGNSQYGTCWITNGTENKKIKKEDLESYTNDGWERGRKLK